MYSQEDKEKKLKEVFKYLKEGCLLQFATFKAKLPMSTYRRWLAQYQQGGIAALADRPKS